jgi:hypothetical protein
MVQVCLMGWWVLVFSCIPFFRKFAPIKDQNQLLSDTLLLIEYLKLRATFLTKRRVTSTLNKASFFNIKLTKSTRLSENTTTARKRSGRSHYEKNY